MMGIFKKKLKKQNRSESIIFNSDGNTTLKEAYIRLKDNVLYFAIDGKKNVIQVESSTHAESKTTTISNLAVCLGLSGKKVVIVDLDFHKARVHRHFEIKNENGLSDYMAGDVAKDALVKKTKYENVEVINRGREITNSSMILTSEKLSDLIQELRKEYDFVLLDCPPVLLVSDYIHISRLSDGVLFLVAHAQTSKNQVAESIKLLKKNGVDIFGAVYTFYNPKRSGNFAEYKDYKYYGYSEKPLKK